MDAVEDGGYEAKMHIDDEEGEGKEGINHAQEKTAKVGHHGVLRFMQDHIQQCFLLKISLLPLLPDLSRALSVPNCVMDRHGCLIGRHIL